MGVYLYFSVLILSLFLILNIFTAQADGKFLESTLILLSGRYQRYFVIAGKIELNWASMTPWFWSHIGNHLCLGFRCSRMNIVSNFHDFISKHFCKFGTDSPSFALCFVFHSSWLCTRWDHLWRLGNAVFADKSGDNLLTWRFIFLCQYAKLFFLLLVIFVEWCDLNLRLTCTCSNIVDWGGIFMRITNYWEFLIHHSPRKIMMPFEPLVQNDTVCQQEYYVLNWKLSSSNDRAIWLEIKNVIFQNGQIRKIISI